MKYFYSFLLAVLPFIGFSQDYFPGSITKADGTNIMGYISIDNSFTPTFVKFRTNRTDSEHSYGPAELLAFQLDGKDSYITYHGRTSMDKNRFPYIAKSLDTATVVNTLFLKVVYQGKKISLFSQTDVLKTRYFITEANNNFEELKYYYYNVDYGVDKKVETYKGQLSLLAQKNHNADNTMMSLIDKTLFEEDDLKHVVVLLDKDQSAHNTLKPKVFIGAGVANVSLKFEGTTPFDQAATKTTAPHLNFGIDLYQPTSNFTFRFAFELWTMTPKFSNKALQGEFDTLATVHYTYQQNSLTIKPQVLYSFVKNDNFSLYLGIGASITLSSYKNIKTDAERVGDPYKFKGLVAGVPASLGVEIAKKVDIVVSYAAKQGYNDSTTFPFSLTSQEWQVGIHYNIL